jgi:shikimate dehydrogenase
VFQLGRVVGPADLATAESSSFRVAGRSYPQTDEQPRDCVQRGSEFIVRSITKDTVLCMSLACRPSHIGTRFHNFLYAELSLDFVYKAFTTTDLAAAIAGIRALGIRGCGVSMPYKAACIESVDAMDASAEAIGSVNTIVNTDGQLRAYNTDYLAIAKLLADHQVPVDHTFAVLGSGGHGQGRGRGAP